MMEPAYTISSPGAFGSGELKNCRITSPTGMSSPLIVNNYSEFQVNIISLI